jgi:hypothetical protein
LSQLLIKYDARYYLTIARYGYSADGTERAFFPLYPMLIRLVHAVTGGTIPFTAVLLSSTCFLATGPLLYLLVTREYGREIGLWAVATLYVFPTAFFLAAVYPESLFLCLSAGSLLMLRRGHLVAAGLLAGLAGATRPTGVLLVAPLVVEFVVRRDFSVWSFVRLSVAGFVSVLGALIYFLYGSMISGSFSSLSWYSALQQAEWRRYQAPPWETLIDGVMAATTGRGINPDWFSRTLVIHDLFWALVLLAVTVWSIRRLPASLTAYLVATTLVVFSSHGPFGYAFWSAPRYVMATAPLFLVLALVLVRLPLPVRLLLLGLSLSWQLLLVGWFASGRWVA